MIDLFALGVALTIGTPTGLFVADKVVNHKENNIKRTFKKIFREKDIKNNQEEFPIVEDIKLYEWGFRCSVDLVGICSYEEFEKYLDFINTTFRAVNTIIQYCKGKAIVEVLNNPITELKYNYIGLPPTKLLFGFDGKGVPIIADMKKTPHVGIVGTSNMGKSYCIELALNNLRGADITLLNCFDTDFKTVKAKRVNGNENILEYLKSVSEIKTIREKPLFVVIDEFNVLSNVKGIDKVIQDLLSQARHFNIYIICIMQLGNKEDCKFKNLFNVRICFRSIESSMLKAFLGVNVDNEKMWVGDFFILNSELIKGRTYIY